MYDGQTKVHAAANQILEMVRDDDPGALTRVVDLVLWKLRREELIGTHSVAFERLDDLLRELKERGKVPCPTSTT